MPDLSPTLITARLLTLVAELLLLGLGLLLVLAEYRRGRRLHLRPLLVCLSLLVVVIGVSGVVGTVEDSRWVLFSPFVAVVLRLLQTIALISLLTHYFQIIDPEEHGPGLQITRYSLYVAAGLGLGISGYYQLPGVYGILDGGRVAHIAFDVLMTVLAIWGGRLLWREVHPQIRLMSATLVAFAFWTMADIFFANLLPLLLLAEIIAVLTLVASAVMHVTAELTSIALELHHTSQQLEQSSRALRQLHFLAHTMLRTGSVRACLTTLLDVLAFQLNLRNSVIFLLSPTEGHWKCYKLSPLNGQASVIGDLPLERKQFLTELILAGQPVTHSGSLRRVDQDFLNLTDFSKNIAIVPLHASRVSYTPHGDNEKSPLARGSQWQAEPCWIADRVCMKGLGNFPQRLDTCRTCPAFEPLGAVVTDLRHVPEESRPALDVLETLADQASLALRDLIQLEELVTDIRFRTAALDPLSLGIVLLGPDGRITALNRVIRQLAGPKAGGWIGQFLGEVPLSTQPGRLRHLIEEILRSPREEPEELAVEVVGPKGLRQCQIRIHPLVRNHVLTGLLCTVEDRTETLELQRTVVQQERFAAMGQLAMGIAHEVNNPIAGVSGLLQMLQKRLAAEAPEQKPIQTALNDLRRASETIRNLLQFARPRPAELKPTDVNKLLDEVIDLQGFHPLAKEVTFEADLHPEVLWAQTDQEALAQVLTNLTLNALQAMNGKGTIAVGTYALQSRILLSIRDTGPGIPLEILPRIFEPFFSTKKSGQGTGLGLSLCDMLLGGLGSTLAVVSSPEGTEFLIVLPFARPPQSRQALPESTEASPVGP